MRVLLSDRTGTSGAAVLLVLAALRQGEQVPGEDRPKVPVPLMFTLHGWDPKTQVQDWLRNRRIPPLRSPICVILRLTV